MRSTSVSQTGVGASAALPLDPNLSPFNCSLSTKVTGSATYTIQHTFDNVMDATVTPTWYNHDNSVFVNATANGNDNYAFPVTATRINQTVGSGSVTLIARQGTKG